MHLWTRFARPVRVNRLFTVLVFALFASIGALSASTAVLAAPSTSAVDASTDQPAHRSEIDEWHRERIERLRQPTGWLSLVGLFALPDGEHVLGSGEGVELRVPEGHGARIAKLTVKDGGVSASALDDADLTVDGEDFDGGVLAPDVTGSPTQLRSGSLQFYVIERSGRPYLRVKDREAPLLKEFEGIDRWPVNEQWRIEARWERFDQPHTLGVPNVLGTVDEVEITGRAVFEIDGRRQELTPTSEDESGLFFVFGDATNGLTSYGAGRFLSTEAPTEDGMVILDFNRAYNPPCVFTPFATCPLPPEGCTLDFEVTAGEKMYGDPH